jgi:hypothetical protein
MIKRKLVKKNQIQLTKDQLRYAYVLYPPDNSNRLCTPDTGMFSWGASTLWESYPLLNIVKEQPLVYDNSDIVRCCGEEVNQEPGNTNCIEGRNAL